MMTHMQIRELLLITLLALGGCGEDKAKNTQVLDAGVAPDPDAAAWESQAEVLQRYDPAEFNQELVVGMPTIDIAFYFSEDGPLAWEELATGTSLAPSSPVFPNRTTASWPHRPYIPSLYEKFP